MAHENGQIVLEVNDIVIKASDSKIGESLMYVRGQLDEFLDDSKLKEFIILHLSKNYFKWRSENADNLNSQDNGKNNKDLDVPEDLTFEEWQEKLQKLVIELKRVVECYFPNLWNCLEFQLAIKNILHIHKCNLPFAGIILGPPSSMKTVGIELFRKIENVFYSDNFSPKSFVSHSTSVKKEELCNVDLLPKIKDKLFLTPELSPIFAKKDEDLTELLGILIRILDGKGYESDSGTQGHRGYSGEFMFTWVGAAVEISRKVHRLLSSLGPKLYFYRIPKTEKSENELLGQIKGIQFNEKFLRVQDKLQEYLNWFQRYPNKVFPEAEINTNDTITENVFLKIQWDESKDEENAIRIIIRLAKLLSRLRGILQTWETNETQGTEYAYSLPIIEEPDRAITQLRNLARGHALIYGRSYITIDDIPLIIRVVLSTASIERVKVLDLLLNAGGKLSTSQITNSLNVSNPTAKRTMAEFKGLGLVNMAEGDYENSEKLVHLKSEFSWFLEEEFKNLRDNFSPDFHSRNKDLIDSSSLLQEKLPLSSIDINQDKLGIRQEAELYECYYCDVFSSTIIKKDYEQHVVSKHPGRLGYPTLVDLRRYGIKPKGKSWE